MQPLSGSSKNDPLSASPARRHGVEGTLYASGDFRFFACEQDFQAMERVGERTRHCEACARDLIDLSRYTRAQARRIFENHEEPPCIALRFDDRGRPVFASPPAQLKRQRRGARALLAAAAAPMLLAACEPAPPDPPSSPQEAPAAEISRAHAEPPAPDLEDPGGARAPVTPPRAEAEPEPTPAVEELPARDCEPLEMITDEELREHDHAVRLKDALEDLEIIQRKRYIRHKKRGRPDEEPDHGVLIGMMH